MAFFKPSLDSLSARLSPAAISVAPGLITAVGNQAQLCMDIRPSDPLELTQPGSIAPCPAIDPDTLAPPDFSWEVWDENPFNNFQKSNPDSRAGWRIGLQSKNAQPIGIVVVILVPMYVFESILTLLIEPVSIDISTLQTICRVFSFHGCLAPI